MKEIQLSQGKTAQVDDEDFDALNQYKWYADKAKNTWYAGRTIKVNGKKTSVRMHCFLLVLKGVDHEDGNGLNNQRYNLRPANQHQNGGNVAKVAGCASQYKGVSFSTEHICTAQITVNRKKIHLGSFGTDQVAAAKAYDAAAVHYFGKFARINFPVDKTPAVV